MATKATVPHHGVHVRAKRLLKIPAEPSPELRIPRAAQTRVISMSGIRLGSGKSARAFKEIICDDVSEFESYMPSHAVGLSQVRSPAIVMHVWVIPIRRSSAQAPAPGTARTIPGRMRSWHQPAHHANAHQDDHDDDDGQYQLHRDFVWTSVGHWSSSPLIPRLKPPWATRSAALAFPVRRSSARHRNDRGMHRRWRYPGNRSEYRTARPRVGSGRAGLRLLRRKPRHSRLRCARALRCARFGFHGFLSERKFSIHKVPLETYMSKLWV
jgi:hypothetical protein